MLGWTWAVRPTSFTASHEASVRWLLYPIYALLVLAVAWGLALIATERPWVKRSYYVIYAPVTIFVAFVATVFCHVAITSDLI